MKRFDLISAIGVAFQLGMIMIGLVTKQYGYFFENFVFIGLIIFLDIKQNTFKINFKTFTLTILFFSMHSLAIFGLYANSHLPIPYDWIIHFFGMFVLSIVLLNWLGKDFLMCALIILACLGVGSLIENIEYFGYLNLGEGDGLLFYGSGDIDDINHVGGGFENVNIDLFMNLFGSLLGLIVFLIRRVEVKK